MFGIDAVREGTMLFKAALGLLVVWVLGLVFAVGQIIHILLLVGLMLLLLSFAKSREATVRRQDGKSDQ
jgi:hypothetical protein